MVGDEVGKLVGVVESVVVGNGDNVTVLWVGLVVDKSSSDDVEVVDALCS